MENRMLITVLASGGIALVVILTGLALYLKYTTPEGAGMGVLAGRVTIEPACPEGATDTPCTVPDEEYRAHSVIVRDRNGQRITQRALDAGGAYRIMITSGPYMFDIATPNEEDLAEFPVDVYIPGDATTTVNVTIATQGEGQ